MTILPTCQHISEVVQVCTQKKMFSHCTAQPEMEKGGRRGRAACANFPQLCFNRAAKDKLTNLKAIWRIFTCYLIVFFWLGKHFLLQLQIKDLWILNSFIGVQGITPIVSFCYCCNLLRSNSIV